MSEPVGRVHLVQYGLNGETKTLYADTIDSVGNLLKAFAAAGVELDFMRTTRIEQLEDVAAPATVKKALADLVEATTLSPQK